MLQFSMVLNLAVLLLASQAKNIVKGFIPFTFIFKGQIPADKAGLLGLLLALNKSVQPDFELSLAKGVESYLFSDKKRIELLSLVFPNAGEYSNILPSLLQGLKESLGCEGDISKGIPEKPINVEEAEIHLLTLCSFMGEEFQNLDALGIMEQIKNKREANKTSKEEARANIVSSEDVFKASQN